LISLVSLSKEADSTDEVLSGVKLSSLCFFGCHLSVDQCDQTFCDQKSQILSKRAQRGVLPNKDFLPRKLLKKYGNLKTKSRRNLELI
jgi:hypothetical protein